MSGELLVDPQIITDNTRRMMAETDAELMAVVKANGYGLGAAVAARSALAAGVRRLGVAGLDEARQLRAAGISEPILSWLNPVDSCWDWAVQNRVAVGVPGMDHLHSIAVGTRSPPVHVHLQFDVGMGREGCSKALWTQFIRSAIALERKGVIRILGVMGHLSQGAVPGHPENQSSVDRLGTVRALVRSETKRAVPAHLAATASVLHEKSTHLDMVRVGAGLVGIDPAALGAPHEDKSGLCCPIQLTARVIETRRILRGQSVGYGQAWTAPKDTNVALVPLGYADGIPRSVAAKAQVWARGHRLPLVGEISMDQVVVDTDQVELCAGEPVVFMGGPGPSVQEWAHWADTLPHEIMTGLGPRIVRKVKGTPI